MAESGGIVVIDAEEGDTSEFDSVTQEGSNTFAADAGAANNGSYGFKITYDGTNDEAYGYDGFTAETDVYARCYVYIPSTLTSATAWSRTFFLGIWDAAVPCARASFKYNGSNTAYTWETWLAYGVVDTDATNFSTDAWHYVEIRYLKHAATGGVQMWVDGTLVHDDLDQAAGLDPDRVYVGSTSGSTPAVASDYFYLDDIKVDTSQVGAYSDAGGASVPLIKPLYGPLGGPLAGVF